MRKGMKINEKDVESQKPEKERKKHMKKYKKISIKKYKNVKRSKT